MRTFFSLLGLLITFAIIWMLVSSTLTSLDSTAKVTDPANNSLTGQNAAVQNPASDSHLPPRSSSSQLKENLDKTRDMLKQIQDQKAKDQAEVMQ